MNSSVCFGVVLVILEVAAAICLPILNIYLAKRKKYNWAVIIPISAVPFLVYGTERSFYWIFHGAVMWMYILIAAYAGLIVISPIVCRIVMHKRKLKGQAETIKK